MTNYKVSEVGPLDAWGSLSGVAPGKEFVEGALGNEFIGLSINSTEPGDTSPFWHVHNKIEEIYVFLEGEGQMALDDDVIDVGPGTVVRVGQGVWRAVHCTPTSGTPMKWLCIRAGGDTLADIGNDAHLEQERAWPWD